MSNGGTPKARGLPGFLRRSLRMNYDDDDDSAAVNIHLQDKDNTASMATPPASPAGQRPTRLQQPLTPTLPNPLLPKPTMEEMKSEASTTGDSTTSSLSTGSRRDAFISPQTIPSTLGFQGSYRYRQFEAVIHADVVNMSELRKTSWNGVPEQYRAQTWKLLLGYLPVNSSRRKHTLDRKRAEYRDAIAQHYDIDDDTRTMQEQETLRQVLVDVPRTAPDVKLFRHVKVRRALARLLYIWAQRHPASSYVQGINDLATPLMVVFLGEYFDITDVMNATIMDETSDDLMQEVEADCYWCLTNLLAGIQDHYTSDQPGVQRMVMRLEELVNRIDRNLCQYLRGVGIEFMQFGFKWMNCLLLREFNLRCVMRLWDTYFSEGDGGFEDFHVYVCAAFLCQFSLQLQSMEFDELFGFMQRIPTDEWTDTEIEVLLSQA